MPKFAHAMPTAPHAMRTMRCQLHPMPRQCHANYTPFNANSTHFSARQDGGRDLSGEVGSWRVLGGGQVLKGWRDVMVGEFCDINQAQGFFLRLG